MSIPTRKELRFQISGPSQFSNTSGLQTEVQFTSATMTEILDGEPTSDTVRQHWPVLSTFNFELRVEGLSREKAYMILKILGASVGGRKL